MLNVLIHCELLPEAQRLDWWAESDSVPGFSAAASTLVELRQLTEDALSGILAERDESFVPSDIQYSMSEPDRGQERGPVVEQDKSATTRGPAIESRHATLAAA